MTYFSRKERWVKNACLIINVTSTVKSLNQSLLAGVCSGVASFWPVNAKMNHL